MAKPSVDGDGGFGVLPWKFLKFGMQFGACGRILMTNLLLSSYHFRKQFLFSVRRGGVRQAAPLKWATDMIRAKVSVKV